MRVDRAAARLRLRVLRRALGSDNSRAVRRMSQLRCASLPRVRRQQPAALRSHCNRPAMRDAAHFRSRSAQIATGMQRE